MEPSQRRSGPVVQKVGGYLDLGAGAYVASRELRSLFSENRVGEGSAIADEEKELIRK
jgi:hypothetical protein